MPLAPARPAAVAFAALALAGCAEQSAVDDAATSTADYADGEYTAIGAYVAPSGEESIEVTLTIADGVVADVAVTADADDPQARSFQEQFADGIADAVVGKPLAELSVDRVAGSSLTSRGFDAALDDIRAQAAQ